MRTLVNEKNETKLIVPLNEDLQKVAIKPYISIGYKPAVQSSLKKPSKIQF